MSHMNGIIAFGYAVTGGLVVGLIWILWEVFN